MKKVFFGSVAAILALASLTACGKDKDEYDEQGRLILNLRNLYFSSWEGGDPYTEKIQEKFNVTIKPSSYDYNSWGEQVSGSVQSDNLPDVFHFDLESFNFGNTYEEWANGAIIKALPRDMSKWPNLQSMINNVSDINLLKLNGDLYGIPLIYDKDDPEKDYSSFTYVYHRDWAKDLGVYQENDEYTWDQFVALLDAFRYGKDGKTISGMNDQSKSALADVSWGFPSITNFFKDSPHCYTYDESGKVINAFTSDKYLKGLDKARDFYLKDYYFDQVSNSGKTLAYDQYKAGNIGVYYENLSLSNYAELRKNYKTIHPGISAQDLDDATAIMKVRGEDGKFALEGSENWFSMTMFNYDISDEKMEKVLDIMDYLLSEEGTRLAIYGLENYDYTLNDGEVELIESSWLTDKDGYYVSKINGAKYLREMVTLNNDTSSFDPMVDKKSYEILNKWHSEMKAAKAAGELRIFSEPTELKWLSTPLKNENTSGLISEGNGNAMNYVCGGNGFETIEKYKTKFSSKWDDTINEINRVLGK